MNKKSLANIKTHDDFIKFIKDLADDFENNPASWESQDVGSYLEALSAYAHDMKGYFTTNNLPLPEPSWKWFAEMLLIAKEYE